jgi:site-specific recombinase XerD
MSQHNKRKGKATAVPPLPELEHAKNVVLDSLESCRSRRSYDHAMTEFVGWYCSAARLAFNRTVVLQYRIYFEEKRFAPATINVRLAAVRRLAYEAADSGMLSPDALAGIKRVKGVRQIGQRVGNWLSLDDGKTLLGAVSPKVLRGKRDAAMLAVLMGCGLRRSELVGLECERIQQREGHWALVDLVGKAGHLRTVPVPGWAKEAIDAWKTAAGIAGGRLFRSIRKNGVIWGSGLTQNVVWYVVKECAQRARIEKLAPHDLRRSCARWCHTSGGELEQIQFLLGHCSVLTTERYIGCKQNLTDPVNDRIRFSLTS